MQRGITGLRNVMVIVGLGLALALPVHVLAAEVPPRPTESPIVDQAGVLTSEQEVGLAQRIATARQETGNQIGILVIQSLEGDILEEYSIDVARTWGIGQKDRDSGVLLLVAIDDRKMRIEVGRGLEGALTDARSSRIIRNEIAPAFQTGNYYAGISTGTDGIIAAIKGEVDPNLGDDTGGSSGEGSAEGLIPLIIGALFIIPSWLAAILGRSKSWWAGGLLGAGVGGVLGVLVGSVILGAIAAAGLAIVGLAFDYAVSKNYRKHARHGDAPSWWAGGVFMGGGGNDSDGGFGGFGGGGFGGGGASGDW